MAFLKRTLLGPHVPEGFVDLGVFEEVQDLDGINR